VAFFERFLYEEYGVDLADALKPHLPEEDLAILGLAEEEDEYTQLDRLFDLSPESAIVQAYNLVESKFLEVMEVDLDSQRRPFMFWRDPDFPHLLDDLAIGGFVHQDTVKSFRLLREMRNRAAHTAHFQGDESSSNWAEALSIAKDLLLGLDRAIQEDYFSQRRARKMMADNNGDADEAVSQAIDEGESKPES
jgi:hypothetical protein